MPVVESDTVSEQVLGLIRPHFSKVKAPSTYDKVYKDECMFSFDTPFSPGGLFVSLANWQGFGQDFIGLALERGAGCLFVHQVWKRVPKAAAAAGEGANDASMDTTDDTGGSKADPTVLALGVDGGFRTDEQKYDIVKTHRLVAFKAGSGTDGVSVSYPDEALPTIVSQAVDAIIEHQGAAEQTEVNQWVADNELIVSKYADTLEHVDSGRRISSDPKTWVCEDSGKTENLWLNLSTGKRYIGSGRQNWDGSGGTGAALRHYEETGRKYPLAVKLGTITPNGADVYSYAPEEDSMVKDPKLAEHLARWGIDVLKVEKTDKTMAELEVELNKSYDFNKITEAGAKLRPLSGPGFTGIKNLGNSCYMNSCLQVLCTLPEIGQKYDGTGTEVFKTAPEDIASDFPAQMSKVASALLSGKYSTQAQVPPSSGEGVTPAQAGEAEKAPAGDGKGEEEGEELVVVAPRMFKHLVGQGHAEFSSGRQQDAAEYMQHLLEFMRRSERTSAGRLGGGDGARETAGLFQFRLVDRLQCQQSGTVKYTTQAADNLLSLQIPVEAAVNKTEVEAYKERLNKRQKCDPKATTNNNEEEVEEEIKPVVPLSACLARLAADETLPDYRSPATGKAGPALKHVRLGNFPRYLLVQLRRYYVDTDWQPKKMDVEVEVPLTLDLESLRSTGMQADEVPMPEGDDAVPPAADDPAAAAAAAGSAGSGAQGGAVVPDAELVSQLMGMGFQENGCRRAAVAVNNASAEVAMNWVLEHMGDADFNDPLPAPGASTGTPAAAAAAAGGDAAPDPEALMMLVSLGFTERQASGALKATGGDAARGADWLYSHTDDLDKAVSEQLDPKAAAAGGEGGGSASDAPIDDGPGRYSLVGFISHVGKNTGCGHYVAHIRKEGRWAIFDDRKVAESEHPPLSLGYLYLFKRDE
ncbi:unnamed protein product [Ectocarpus sp. 6 AP-2014]